MNKIRIFIYSGLFIALLLYTPWYFLFTRNTYELSQQIAPIIKTYGKTRTPNADHMKNALDDLTKHFAGEGHTYNEVYYDELVSCFEDEDKLLYKSQIFAWKGQANYWIMNGTESDYEGKPDHWGQTKDQNGWKEYQDGKQEHIGRYNMLIYEPCNHASNIAYYRSASKICAYGDNWSVGRRHTNGLKRMFATLASMSAFFHGSLTRLGDNFDQQAISLIAFVGHHMQVENLNTTSSAVLDLSNTPRIEDVHKIIENITITIYQKPATDLKQLLDGADYEHDFYKIFGSIVTNIVSVIFPDRIARVIIGTSAKFTVSNDIKEFLINDYMPPLQEALKNVHIPIWEKYGMLWKSAGVLIKIIYAFLYQERQLPTVITSFFQKDFMIRLGGHSISTVLSIADWFTGFKQTDINVNKSFGVYPGQDECKLNQAHSIWHEVSANGLLDLIYLCDHTNYLIKTYNHA